jgi:site-specific recombinase XerC
VENKRLVEVCGDDLAGTRDRALLLVGFASALRRSELVAIDVEHLRTTSVGIRLVIPRSKTDAAGAGAEIGIMSGADEATCSVRALRAWSSLRRSPMARCFGA